MTDNEEMAEAMWDAALTGRYILDGKETKVSVADRIEIMKFILDIIDGPPGQASDIKYLEKYDD